MVAALVGGVCQQNPDRRRQRYTILVFNPRLFFLDQNCILETVGIDVAGICRDHPIVKIRDSA
jgi:hypothetical protein